MATSYTRNLRLRLIDNIDAVSKYNLEKLDLLGAIFQTDTLGNTTLRSGGNIVLEPEADASGGDGTGGSVSVGTDAHEVDSFIVHASSIEFNNPVGILDSATGGSKFLRINYKSDISGSVDTAADRQLSLDLNGADRSLTLSGNVAILGSSSVSLTSTGPTNLTLPTSGTLATLADIVSSPGSGDVRGYATGWFPADGLTKTVTHSLASTDVDVTVRDMLDETVILTDSITVADSSTVNITASELPSASGWRVVVQVK